MIKLDAGLLSRLRPGTTTQNSGEQSPTERAGSKRTQSSYSLHITKSDANSFSLFHKTIKRNVNEAIEFKSPVVEQGPSEEELAAREERADLAASNILSFVEQRLRADVADGASQEQLASRLDAALEGFEKGYDEANDILKDLNLLSGKVEDDISLTKEKVLAGLDELKQSFLNADSDAVVKADAKSAEPKGSSETVAPSSYSSLQSSLQMGAARDFSFSLTTKDGDKVNINASSIAAFQQSSGRFEQTTENGSLIQQEYLSFEGYRESQFAFSVEGELDEDELQAINNLLNNVNDLSQDFYAGDMASALDKALSLGYDNNEISGFALSLTQVQNVRMMQTYQPEQEILKPSVLSELKPIGKFANELAQSLTMAKDMFSHPRELLSELTKQFSEMNQPENFDSSQSTFLEFAQELLDKFEQLESATDE